MDFSQILSVSWQFLVVVAISFSVMCLIASHIRFQNLAHKATAADAGMDPHDAFQVAIAHALGTVHMAPEPFCVLFAVVHDLSGVEQRYGPGTRGDLLKAFEARIRSSLRSTDTVMLLSDERLGIMLNAPYVHAGAVCQRLVERVSEAPFRCASGPVVPLAACIGGVAHPEHGERVKELFDGATLLLEQAVAKGPGSIVLAPVPDAPPEKAEVAPSAVSGLIDPLTGLLRPEKVGPAVQKYMSRFRRQHKPVSLLLFDVDHLQRYNEHYGREAGDALLRGLGKLLQEAFREEDLVARLGGEEFLVVMGCAPAAALIAGQRVVSLVKRTSLVAGAGTLRITLSGGIAGYPDHGGHPRHLLDCADAALMAAKDRGRNMCLVYDASMRDHTPPVRPADAF